MEDEKLSGFRVSETSESICKPVQMARNIQQTQFTNPNSQYTDIICNTDMHVRKIRQFFKLQDEGQSLMQAMMRQLSLSARAYHCKRSVKLVRTIADLAESEEIPRLQIPQSQNSNNDKQGG